MSATVHTAAGDEQRLPESLLGAALISGFVIMLLLDQIHTAVFISFQTSPPPANNDPEDPGEVQELLEAQNGLRKKHIWVSMQRKLQNDCKRLVTQQTRQDQQICHADKDSIRSSCQSLHWAYGTLRSRCECQSYSSFDVAS